MSSQPEAGDGVLNVGTSRSFVKKYKFKSIKAQIVPPGVPAYDLGLCNDYIISKEETRHFTEIPESDLEYVRPPVEYQIECRKLMENDVKLAEMRKTFAETRIDLNKQWERLHYDEVELRKGFLRFNQFVKENLEKRERATKKTGDEIILKQKRTADVEKLKENLRIAYRCRKNMDKVMKQYSVYEAYLGDVVKKSAQFKTIDDVINRFDTLNAARIKLVARQQSAMADLEIAMKKKDTLETKHRLAALGLNNAIAFLEERFKNVNQLALVEERIVEKIKHASVQVAAEEQLVKATIRNVYRHMCDRKGLSKSTLSLDDYEGMLVFIKKSIDETLRAQQALKASVSKFMMQKQ